MRSCAWRSTQLDEAQGRRSASRRRPSWQPSPSQARLIDVCLAPADRQRAQLEAWCRHYGDHSLESDTRGLLPFMFGRLVDAGINADIIERARTAYLETSWQNLARIARLTAVLRRFEKAGIPAVLLKGAALALRYYRNLGVRSMADVDLLVRPADVGRAAALLAELGWTPTGRAEADLIPAGMRVLHARPFEAAPLHSLDLHWTLNVRSPEVDEMFWAATDTFETDSLAVRMLSPADQIFHVCTHAVQPSWSPSPRWIIDVMTVLDSPGIKVDWARMVDVARRTNATVRLQTALMELMPYAFDRIPASVPDALRSAAAPRWERRELALFSRLPPFGRLDALRWHWYFFRRLRPSDRSWSHWPLLVGFVEYLRLCLKIRGGA